MKKILTVSAFLIVGFSIMGQTQNTATGDPVSQNFLRPGVVITTMNFSGVQSINLNSASKPKEFDNFNVVGNSGSLSIAAQGKKSINNPVYDNEVQAFVSSLSGKVIEQALFIENGKLNTTKLFERSKNSMTESQRNVLKNLTGTLDNSAKNLLLNPILDNNYVVVVSPTSITTSVDKKGKTTISGSVAVSVYKVHVGEYLNAEGKKLDIEAKKNQFMAKFGSDFSAVATSTFPVEKIFSGVSKLPASGETMDQFYDSSVSTAVLVASGDVDEFKPRAKVEENMLIALGSKEGLKVDDRYFSYERVKDPETREIVLKRKGIDRVKKVGNTDIDLVADKDASVERSIIYADGGKKTKTGYISMKAPEYGVGISAFFRQNPGARIDYRVGKYIGIPNLLAYVDAEFIQLDGLSGYLASAGLQKNFNLGRMFALAPFAQYAVTANLTDGDEEYEVDANVITAGLRTIIKFGPSIQLIPEFTYVIDPEENFYDKQFYVGFALRYNL